MQVSPLGEYEPLMLTIPAHMELYWHLIEPLLERSTREAMHGEFDIADLKALAFAGKAHIFVLTNDKTGTNPDRSVSLALAAELVMYPKFPALNIIALGGNNLGMAHRKFWKQFCGWAYMNGVRTIEGWVSPGMQRLLERFGFKQIYSHMRFELTEI